MIARALRTTLAPALLLLSTIALVAGCSRMPHQYDVPEPRATVLSGLMMAGSLAENDPKIDTPVNTPEEAWVGVRKLYPDDAKECDGWAKVGPFFVFSVRPEEKKQEAGFKTVVYVKAGDSQFHKASQPF